MGHWGVRSYEIDEAADALDAAFERVHGDRYESLMDDRNPMTPDQVHRTLVSPATLAAAIDALAAAFGPDPESWDEVARLAFAGVVVRHAEFGVPLPPDARARALDWLRDEDIDWDEATKRRLRREAEIELLLRVAAT
jgi:hypothetical protein